MIVASHRQERTHLPPLDECPLCPSTHGHASEIPASDYDVVVFENRFPSLTSSPKTSRSQRPPWSRRWRRPMRGHLFQQRPRDLVLLPVGRASGHDCRFDRRSDPGAVTFARGRIRAGLRESRIRRRSDAPPSSWPDLRLSLHPAEAETGPPSGSALSSRSRQVSLLCGARRRDGGWAAHRRRDGRTSSPMCRQRHGGPTRSTFSHEHHVADLADLTRDERGELLRLQADVICGFRWALRRTDPLSLNPLSGSGP